MVNKISAVVLVKNEEKNILRCLKSLDFCAEIIIVDDYSNDQTLNKIRNSKSESSKKIPLKIFKRELKGDFSKQRNFGMAKAGNDWILFVDGDEEVTKELMVEIVKLLDGYITDENKAFYIKRRDYFWDKELKYGETAKAINKGIIRLVNKQAGKWVGSVHEEFQLKPKMSPSQRGELKFKTLNGYLNHYPHQTVKDFLRHINFYSSLRAKELMEEGKKTNIFEIVSYPPGKFLFAYFIKLGFLDGPEGFVYAFFMAFHSFLVRAKLYQYQNISGP